MTAPTVQDPRSDMRLHCRFDMGGEELYAVKWYKDDHEFFRYTPVGEDMVTFPVPGVQVDSRESKCDRNSCDLLLMNMKRPQSSGAYRCEVSSEAPAFRLASETHNITVAALPEEKPNIEGVKDKYSFGDYLVATCTSGLGDPKPILKFNINKQPVSNSQIKDISPDEVYDDEETGLQLRRTKLQLRLIMDRKTPGIKINSRTDLVCVSSIEGLDQNTVLPTSTTRSFVLGDDSQVVNEMFQWPSSKSGSGAYRLSKALALVTTFNYFYHYRWMQ